VSLNDGRLNDGRLNDGRLNDGRRVEAAESAQVTRVHLYRLIRRHHLKI
jgi:hypothetical protein